MEHIMEIGSRAFYLIDLLSSKVADAFDTHNLPRDNSNLSPGSDGHKIDFVKITLTVPPLFYSNALGIFSILRFFICKIFCIRKCFKCLICIIEFKCKIISCILVFYSTKRKI